MSFSDRGPMSSTTPPCPAACICVLPSPTELEIETLPGPTPGTALRVSVEPASDGYVRLEHLAFNENVGWYTQKSFCVPTGMIDVLVIALRKADCLSPKPMRRAGGGLRTLTPELPEDSPCRELRSG